MTDIQTLKQEIEKIKERNARVEKEKMWETSWTRRLSIFVLTYLVVVIFFLITKLPYPFANALVPAVAFVLSTITLPAIKKWWVKK